MLKKISVIVSALNVLLFVLACDTHRVYDEYRSLPNQWHKDSIVNFEVQPPDTLNAYNLYINLRANNAYKYNNLYLIAELNYPNGKAITDTLEYKMAAPTGELLGKGFSDVKESKLWYKGYDSDFIFNETGIYNINIQHAMRKNGEVNGVENLEGITEIGFRIEKK